MLDRDEDVAGLVNEADELGQRIADVTVDELATFSRSLMDRRRRGEQSPEVLASALAASREAVRRATGNWAAPAVLGAVATSVTGAVPAVPGRTDRQAALAMALYWHSLAGKGAHLVSVDERSARDALKLFDPVGQLLGCDIGLVTQAATGVARRSAYAATVTFGSYAEMAADYLRDNLHDLPEHVVQRGLHAAVVDDVAAVAPRALSHVMVTAPRTAKEPRQVQGIAASFRRGSDYRPERKQRAILFTAPGVARLKTAVGWDEVPSLKAVSTAERVENAIVRREGLGRPDGHEMLAEISVLGYLGAYEALTGFSSRRTQSGSIDDVLAADGRAAPHPSELSFERLIDRQRSQIYGFRTRVREDPEPIGLVHSVAGDTVRAWLMYGADSLTAGLRDVLAGRQTPEQIDDAVNGASAQNELVDRATLLVEKVVEGRVNELGAPEMAALLRKVFLTVVDIQWQEHLLRMRFLQRQSGVLYGSGANAAGGREADAAALFAGCEQAIRVESLKYALNVRL